MCSVRRFAHDAVRWRDRVFVCSTGAGEILEFALQGMTLVRVLHTFQRSAHVNTLAPDGQGGLWAMLHMHGEVREEWKRGS